MLTLRIVLAACCLVSYAAADLPRIPESAYRQAQGESTLAKRAWDGWQTFPEKCKENCKPYIDIRKNCGAPVDASLLKDGSDKLACACSTAYFDATVACAQCAPEPFRKAIDDSAKEWVESALDICIDSGKEMECIDTSSLSTEVGQDDGDGAAESEGASDEPKGSTGSIPTGSSDAIKPSASPTNATASGNSTLIGGPARETLLPASDNEESNLVELPSGAVSSFIFNNQAFLMPILLASVFIHINYFK